MTKSTASEYNTGHQLGAYLLVTVSNASAPLWLLQRPFLISFFFCLASFMRYFIRH